MNKNKRIEKDLLGELEVDADALFGIHTLRAVENFNISQKKVEDSLIRAFGCVKLAALKTNYELGYIKEEIFLSLEKAAIEMKDGLLSHHIIVDALQGGAGTSTNMNVNEVLANRALIISGKKPGEYDYINPLSHVNMHQSTNDTYPTALKVASIIEFSKLEKNLTILLNSFEKKEKDFEEIIKIGRTELQDAVLTTVGKSFSAYAEAISRDRWRIYKSCERLKEVNLGGTAIGTGILAPREYIFKVVENLKKISNLNIARATNLLECTQNCDVFVEVHGMLLALASTLMKIANDFRFLSSGPNSGISEYILPERQSGSSIMPGKVNPVIPEAVIQTCLEVIGNGSVLTHACASGNLELNAFMPLIADKLLNSIRILNNITLIFNDFCVKDLKINKEKCIQNATTITSVSTAIAGKIGYKKAEELIKISLKENRPIKEVILSNNILTEQEYNDLISPENVLRLGSE